MKNILIIPGAQKSGTNTIKELIVSNLKNVRKKSKEKHIFSIKNGPSKKIIEWYKRKINNASGCIFIDKSTSYLSCPGVPARIRYHFPGAKILIILRDPARRVFSGLQHSKKKFRSLDRRNTEEYVECIRENADESGLYRSDELCLTQALEKEKLRSGYFGKGYLRRRDIAPFDAPLWDPNWQFKYFQVSMYSRGIKRFKREFDSDQIQIVILEDLVEHTERVVTNIADFLDLELRQGEISLPHRNKTALPRNSLTRTIGWLRHRTPGLSELIDWGVRSMPQLIRGLRDKLLMGKRPTLSTQLYQRMRDLLEDEYAFVTELHPQVKELWT